MSAQVLDLAGAHGSKEETSSGPASHAQQSLRVVLLQTQAEAAGAQEISRILGNGLTAAGHDVHHVFCFRRTAVFDDQPNTFFCALERPRGFPALVRMAAVLVRYLKVLRPDAIVCFQHYGNIVGILAARLAGVRSVIINRNSARSLIPWWMHHLELAFGMAGWFQSLVVNSGSVEDEYAGYPRSYRRRLIRIDHGFERKTTTLSRQDARQIFSLPADVILLGSAGRLHPTKNFQAAIRVLVGRPWHLVLAGQGPARKDLVDLASSLGVLDRLHFAGELPPERMGDFLASLDVFVFPSKAETFGLAAVEAAQAGAPVVANDLAVMREVLAVGGQPCALFVDVDDTRAFAARIEQIVSDPSLKTELVIRAGKLSKRYSADAMVAQYADLIGMTVARGNRPSPKAMAR
jgi:glycosyltransferase involved in cell wall biosynthesis